MDTIIPIIFTLAFFLFQAYLNYKKEQEKSKKRSLGKPHEPAVPNEKPLPELTDWLEEILQPKTNQSTGQRSDTVGKTVPPVSKPIEAVPEKHKVEEYKRIHYKPTETPINLLKEYRNLPEKREMEELKQSKVIRQVQHELKRLHALEVVEEERQTGNSVEFNFRDAIIMNAILERPYQ